MPMVLRALLKERCTTRQLWLQGHECGSSLEMSLREMAKKGDDLAFGVNGNEGNAAKTRNDNRHYSTVIRMVLHLREEKHLLARKLIQVPPCSLPGIALTACQQSGE